MREWDPMNKLGIATAMTLLLTGAASAQVRPGEPAVAQAALGYAVEGLTLGSKLKRDSAMYREYKCSPSEQFDGFTWCQRSRRDSEKRGSFDVIYSMLHAKDGTIVYINRYQQPAFFDTNESDRDIQNYTRKFGGGSPQITKMPRRSGGTDAVLATWGNVELVPLDSDSIKVVAQGKSPKKGLLIDFIANFTGSAQEGLPVYRITGGAGFVWSGSFDQKGRGALRFAAVDASALQSEASPSVALQSAQPSATDRVAPPAPAEPIAPPPAAKPEPPAAEAAVQPPPKPPIQPPAAKPAVQPPAEPVAQPPAVEPAAPPPPARLAVRPAPPPQSATPPQNADAQSAASQAEVAAAVKARRDAEVTVAQLQTELSVALQAKADAEQARAQAERVAQQARSDAELARKEFELARNEANAANDEIDRLAAGGMPASFVKGAIFIGISAAAVLFFIILAIAKILVWMSARKEADIDQEELVNELAKSLGVEEPPPALPAVAADAGVGQAASEIEGQEINQDNQEDINQEKAQVATNGHAGSFPSAESSDGAKPSSADENNGDAAKSIVPGIPDAGEAETIKPAPAGPTSQPANTAS